MENVSKKEKQRVNGLSVAGFVVSFFNSIIGLVLCIVGLNNAKKYDEACKELAIAGIIISAIKIFASIIATILITIFGLFIASNYKDFINTDAINGVVNVFKCYEAYDCDSLEDGTYQCKVKRNNNEEEVTCSVNPESIKEVLDTIKTYGEKIISSSEKIENASNKFENSVNSAGDKANQVSTAKDNVSNIIDKVEDKIER